MRAGLDRETIIKAAAGIADKEGAASVTLKTLANKLGVRSPSLYKHFSGGLDELNTELMLYGWRTLEEEIANAAIGRSRDDAIIAICNSYRNFAYEHRGMLEAMQWYNMYSSQEHLQATQGIMDILFRVLEAYDLENEQKVHCIRMLRGFLQGFLSIETHNGFGDPASLDDTFSFSVQTILNGIRDMQEGTQNDTTA